MNHLELYKLLKTVQKNVHCPQCGKEYQFSDIKIKGVADFIIFLELNCKDHMPLLATIATSQKPTANSYPTTDQISPNDLIESYKFLEKFNGGFDKLFRDKKSTNNK